ncbi:MAG TPA: 50S ribosomal protein L24e, partial [Methanomassiliicoccales archaeon]|nr:50S ribosomal protein L24e [Methanomassiliicoccales archaeon]
MVEQHLCSFCGEQIEPGTGKMYVRKDGTALLFCTNKCYKNMIELKRVPRNVTWTKAYATKKGITMAARDKSEQKVEDSSAEKPEVKA